MPPTCLQLDRVSRHFGGLKAVDEVTLSVQPGARHALIGPNGAGKTTLFNLISGELPPTSGSVVLSGTDVTALAPHRRAALGVSRTFQITRLFPDLTVMENMPAGMRRPRPAAVHMVSAALVVHGRRRSRQRACSTGSISRR